MDEIDPRYIDKELPYNLEAEQALLGAALVSNAVMDKVVDFLEPEHFANIAHRDIYAECINLFSKNVKFSPITLKSKFKDHEELEDVGAGKYLAKLASSAITIINAVDYARIIHDLSIRRGIINAAKIASDDAFNTQEKSGQEIINDTQLSLQDMQGIETLGQELAPISEGMNKAMDMVQVAMNDENPITGVATGIGSLDRATGGLKPGQLIVVAGRPAMGKTALALSIAKGAGLSGKNVAVFSIEMEADELTLRVAADFMVDDANSFTYFDAGNGNITQEQYNALSRGAAKVSNLPVHISDKGGNTVESVRMETRRLNRSLASDGRKIDLIAIDYLQLMTMGRGYKGNRVQEISEMTAALKRLAKEMRVPVILLSQLNRGLEVRENKRPMLSDLRDSGSIEQDADTVIFVYREHYYLKDNEPKKVSEQADWQAELQRCEKLLEIILGKQRRGPAKTLRVEIGLETNTIRDFKAC